MTKRISDDPIERVIYDALTRKGILFTMEGDENHPSHRMDFHVPDYGMAIECKWRHSPRISDQTARHRNVIVIQGPEAARFFADNI